MITNLKNLLLNSKGGIASFNTVDLEMAKGCILAAEELNRPIVMGLASRHWEIVGGKIFLASLSAMVKEAKVPIALHLDHAKPEQLDMIKEAIESGMTSIMIDGSALPLKENIKITKKVVELCHPLDISVEAELGAIAGDEGVANLVDSSLTKKYTDSKDAEFFCKETGVDALAIAVGTAHGLYKDTPKLQLDLISEIYSVVGETFLVLHGATGIPDEAIRSSIKRGIRKINFFSGLLQESMNTVRLVEDGDNDYVKLRKAIREACKKTAKEIITLYNC